MLPKYYEEYFHTCGKLLNCPYIYSSSSAASSSSSFSSSFSTTFLGRPRPLPGTFGGLAAFFFPLPGGRPRPRLAGTSASGASSAFLFSAFSGLAAAAGLPLFLVAGESAAVSPIFIGYNNSRKDTHKVLWQ